MEKIYLFGILCLAAWRLASLIANEKGPFHMFLKFRNTVVRVERRVGLVRAFHLYEMVSCEWCNSIWIGIGLWLGWNFLGDEFVRWMTPLAISTVVIIIKYSVSGLELLNKRAETEDSPAPQTT